MCGICGRITVDNSGVGLEELQNMAAAIACRGPDGDGYHLVSGLENKVRGISAGLGHKRLSIIDLSEAGRQPMANEDGSIWLTFNGEIYNFKELRSELVKRGHIFKSQTDTEVIVHLYEEFGVEAAHRLNGMFAFALWDQRTGKLWMCRDRIGIKPLVYHWDGKTLTLASEIKALLSNKAIIRAIDPKALMLYLTYGYVPAPLTIFKGIFKLPPGHMLTMEAGKIEVTAYWDISDSDHHPQQKAFGKDLEMDYRDRLFTTLNDAVRSCMISDVPLGAFLSGGIDSSIIVALMARHTAKAIKTFSIGYMDDPLYDETRYARDVAEMYHTDHREIKLTQQDMLDVFPEVLDTFDEPFADSSSVPTYIISRETRRHVTVALSGDGGDELFAGYRSYLAEYWYSRYRLIPHFVRKGVVEPVIASLPANRDSAFGEYARRAKKFIRGTNGNFHQRVLAVKEIFPAAIRKNLLLPASGLALTNDGDPALKWAAGFLDGFRGDRINRILYFDLKDSLAGDMLNKVDWMSMKNSLEVRVPFLDHRVVELAFGIPGYLKLRNGVTKHFLKQTFKSVLPKSLHRRPKAGFEIPISRWLRTDLRHLLEIYLSEDRIRSQGIFKFRHVQNLITDHLQRKSDTSWMLWNLIVFQHWFDKYLH